MWPSNFSRKKWKTLVQLVSRRGYDFIDVTTGNLVQRTVENHRAYYFKEPFCAPLIYKSLVIWAYNKLYNAYIATHEPSKDWLIEWEHESDRKSLRLTR